MTGGLVEGGLVEISAQWLYWLKQSVYNGREGASKIAPAGGEGD